MSRTCYRKTEFRNYYLKCHRGCVSSKWQDVINGSVEKTTEQSDEAMLNEFYQLLLSTWHTEVKWCAVIFGKDQAPSIVAQLLLEVTLSVESGPGVLINNAVQGLAFEKLQLLMKLHKTTSSFTNNLKKALADHVHVIDPEMLAKLADSFWHSYVPILLQYKNLEQDTLLTMLSDIHLDAHDVIDLVQLLESSINRLFDNAKVAMDRCEELTGSFLFLCCVLYFPDL